MLILSDRQLAAFEEYAIRNFIERLTQHLVSLYPERTVDVDLHAFAKLAIDYGKSNRLSSERDVASLACAMLLLGSQFVSDARFPWAGAILVDQRAWKGPRLHECARIELGLKCSLPS